MKSKAKMITLKFRVANQDIFDAIKTGGKKVETRAATERYRRIVAGDKVILICGKNKFEKRVRKIRTFKTIAALLKKYSIKSINPAVKSAEELRRLYYSFPGYREKIKKFGLIALEFK